MEFTDKANTQPERLQKLLAQLKQSSANVLTKLRSPELSSKYAENAEGILDTYVFTHLSDRTLLLEVTAKLAPQDQGCAGSHRFVSHPAFEKVLEMYTRSSKKPNPVLEKSRPWDVAVTMVMKVEALLPKFCHSHTQLLRWEHAILSHIWESYRSANLEFDDMTGIPLVFDFQELPSETFHMGYEMTQSGLYEEIDLYDKLMYQKVPESAHKPTLSYMTMEKLGPKLSYLMELTSVARKAQPGLSTRTAFKIFDQLMCRLQQIHRFGVSHNRVCPRNIYFGRGMCYNVVYLNNFRAATMTTSDFVSKSSISRLLAKDLRFASLNMMRSETTRPVDDIESAFYTLLACAGPGLPWDSLLQRPTDSSSELEATQLAGQDIENSKRCQSAVRAAKTAFWTSIIHMERFIANLMQRLSDRDAVLFPLIADILLRLYKKVKRLMTELARSESASEFSTQLSRIGSQTLVYSDLRRLVLMYFRFDETPPILNNLRNQQGLKIKKLTKGRPKTFAWNLSEWCFNCVVIRPLLSRVMQ